MISASNFLGDTVLGRFGAAVFAGDSISNLYSDTQLLKKVIQQKQSGISAVACLSWYRFWRIVSATFHLFRSQDKSQLC